MIDEKMFDDLSIDKMKRASVMLIKPNITEDQRLKLENDPNYTRIIRE